MHLPEELQQAIAAEAERFSQQDILSAREALSERYQAADSSNEMPLILTDAERCAYVVARMPATYAVILRVLKELQLRFPSAAIESLLDLGAGPGSAMWAAAEVVPKLKQIQLVERDSSLVALGKRLASYSLSPPLQKGDWQIRRMEHLATTVTHDLVLLSYSIGELPADSIAAMIEKCWQVTEQFLVIIEPGTPAGFERMRAIRSQLIALGGHLVAPCPHADACPMQERNWCHFSERVERSALHRRIKRGALGYEDEKFSYAVFSKQSVFQLPKARILRHPLKRSGHVVMSLCTATEGLQQQTISKRTPELYKLARKLEWGDSLSIDVGD